MFGKTNHANVKTLIKNKDETICPISGLDKLPHIWRLGI